MLRTRLAIGIPIVAVVVGVLWIDDRLGPWYPLWFVASLLLMGQTALEVIGLLNATSARPSGNTVFGGCLALVVANWAPHVVTAWYGPTLAPGLDPSSSPALAAGLDPLAWPLWTFAAIVMFAFIAQSAQFDEPGRTMATISGTVLAVAYVGLLGSFLIQLRWLEFGIVPVAATIATAKGADTGAYTLGRLAGRHKLWPRLSPKKTIEGALGGLAFGVAGALAVMAVARLAFQIPCLTWPETIGFGLLVSSAAQLGDLMESMIKRDCSRKDASDAVPGFGGVLDVLDSLLFAGPVAYGYWLALGP